MMSDLYALYLYSVDDVGQRESFWQHELDTFQSNGLNEREMTLFKLNFS